jgi:hypothetical protein
MLVAGSFNFISSARNALVELDAWRLAASLCADKSLDMTTAGGPALLEKGVILPVNR